MTRIGPTRLILLNCGKFDYAEINLNAPLHLVGPNNIGKTSLIAVLQFLYIDNQNIMKFSSDLLTTRKYYFPDVSSFALFESLGPEGFVLTGVHGLGPIKQYEIERFSYLGQFNRDDYLSVDNSILPWDQIQAKLAHKNYSKLKPSDLRAALLGNENRGKRDGESFVNLSLIPLRRRVEYGRFRNVFLNLLRLNHLHQDELKTLLLDLYNDEFTKREIDLREQFAPQLEQLQRQKADVNDLKKNEPAIRRILDGVTERDRIRGKLKILYSLIGDLFYSYKDDVDKRNQSLDEELRNNCNLINENEAKRFSIEKQTEMESEKLGSLREKQKELQRLENKFNQFNLEWAKVKSIDLGEKLRKIESNLNMAQYESPESIQRHLAQSESKLEMLLTIDLEASFITSLLNSFNTDQIDKLSRLFNKDIFMLSTAGKMVSVNISDYDLLCKYLDEVLDNFSENVYANDAISLNLEKVHPFDIKEYTDPERIKGDILYMKREIRKLKEVLQTAKHQKELLQKKESLRIQLIDLQDECAEYRYYEEKKKANANLDQKLQVVESELSELKEQLKIIQQEHSHLLELQEKFKSKRNNLRSEFEQMSQKVSSLSKPSYDWEDIEYEVRNTQLTEMLETFICLSNDHQRLTDRIEGELDSIHSQTYDRYQAETEKETLNLFQSELETLDEKQKALEENWVSFTVQLKKDFRDLKRDMEKLLSEVSKLNTNLSKVHISNLSKLKINVLVRRELQQYFNQVEDCEQTPLFADTSQTDEVFRKISQMLQIKPVISLQDMFDMQFEITFPNGDIKKYNHLDRIESNGTTITIKVLINLILLQGLLSNESVYVPFYLDECSSLDSENLRSIVNQAREYGFTAILASPEAMDAADNIYYLSENNGRVTLNPQNCLVEVVRVKDGGRIE